MRAEPEPFLTAEDVYVSGETRTLGLGLDPGRDDIRIEIQPKPVHRPPVEVVTRP